MKTEDYKKIFKSIPERTWLSATLQKILTQGDANILVEYLNGTKDINSATVEDLYGIKSKFWMHKNQFSSAIKNIDKLNLDFIGEFENTVQELEDIGIQDNDIFICKQDFLYRNMVQINQGSEIQITEYQYAGRNSLLTAKFIKLMTDENTNRNFPKYDEIPLGFTFQELSNYFDKA